MISTVRFIDDVSLLHKRVLLRVDFNVSLDPKHHIADDTRIRQALPTIKLLLKNRNKIILVTHLGRPEKRNHSDSLQKVVNRLKTYLPTTKITLIEDFLKDTRYIESLKDKEIAVLENIRFYPGEQIDDEGFAKTLASLADVYVNDAFSVSHRAAASVVGVTKFLPSFGGLLLKKEITMLDKIIDTPKKPFVAIIGGKKVSTKLHFISKLGKMADYLLFGGGLANTILAAEGYATGKSFINKDEIDQAKKLLEIFRHEHTEIVLPSDVVIAKDLGGTKSEVKDVKDIAHDDLILDIGPQTQAEFGTIIENSHTLVWNGPVGFVENPLFKRGTDFIYYAITENDHVFSVVGGGDTLAVIEKEEYLSKISHISTGGGAMLEYIENGTLPGIEALEQKQ